MFSSQEGRVGLHAPLRNPRGWIRPLLPRSAGPKPFLGSSEIHNQKQLTYDYTSSYSRALPTRTHAPE